ncbi:uncharacterized protein FIBRA_05624 [Fibroporia radiculosa]|uniref:Zn(2)-C6 fungal-type domain-containing protein n=1 Tax=Fibroporia radiculosa TaxID=599839 RepID=J4GRC5_9APHY|nr:uncharacterized protein FIBRA_05624 [Fibroporia radiculosa]CCM03490.1 predicted protein [Fibroporia radiculosa]
MTTPSALAAAVANALRASRSMQERRPADKGAQSCPFGLPDMQSSRRGQGKRQSSLPSSLHPHLVSGQTSTTSEKDPPPEGGGTGREGAGGHASSWEGSYTFPPVRSFRDAPFFPVTLNPAAFEEGSGSGGSRNRSQSPEPAPASRSAPPQAGTRSQQLPAVVLPPLPSREPLETGQTDPVRFTPGRLRATPFLESHTSSTSSNIFPFEYEPHRYGLYEPPRLYSEIRRSANQPPPLSFIVTEPEEGEPGPSTQGRRTVSQEHEYPQRAAVPVSAQDQPLEYRLAPFLHPYPQFVEGPQPTQLSPFVDWPRLPTFEYHPPEGRPPNLPPPPDQASGVRAPSEARSSSRERPIRGIPYRSYFSPEATRAERRTPDSGHQEQGNASDIERRESRRAEKRRRVEPVPDEPAPRRFDAPAPRSFPPSGAETRSGGPVRADAASYHEFPRWADSPAAVAAVSHRSVGRSPFDVEPSRAEDPYPWTPAEWPPFLSEARFSHQSSGTSGDDGEDTEESVGRGKARGVDLEEQQPEAASGGTSSAAPPDENERPRKISRKTEVACHFCRRRKLRCDGQRPTCRHCMQRGFVCEYADRPRRRGPGKAPKGSKRGARQTSAGSRKAAAGSKASEATGSSSREPPPPRSPLPRPLLPPPSRPPRSPPPGYEAVAPPSYEEFAAPAGTGGMPAGGQAQDASVVLPHFTRLYVTSGPRLHPVEPYLEEFYDADDYLNLTDAEEEGETPPRPR